MSNQIVVIPAHNEEGAIADTIRQVRRAAPDFDIVVVDDASGDNTAQLAAAQGVLVLRPVFNLGIAGARRMGYAFAYDNGYQICVQLDADGQHDAAYIGRLCAPLLTGAADMVIGSRFTGDGPASYHIPRLRRCGMLLIVFTLQMLTGRRVTDPTSGFRAVNRRVLEMCAAEYPFEYPEPEEIVLLARNGLRISEVPVVMRERRTGHSFATPLVSVYYMLEVLLALVMARWRKKVNQG